MPVLPSSRTTKDYAPLADEVNPPFGNIAPAPTVSRNGTIVYSKRISPPGSSPSSDDDHRVNGSTSRVLRDTDETLSGRDASMHDRKGKGRAQWAEDEGDIGRRDAHRLDTVELSGADGTAESYPPLSETEQEEKRVQANLAKFAARDAARRKAKRVSRVASLTDSRRDSSAASSISSPNRSPLSSISEGKRGSLMGFVGGLVGVKEHPATSQDGSDSSIPLAQTQGYSNPYEPAPIGRSTPPAMQSSSPFADPPSLAGSQNSPVRSPTSPHHGDFGYVGQDWRGGHAQQDPQAKPEKWWHALCAWGSDLDGGHGSNQAGRTNPME